MEDNKIKSASIHLLVTLPLAILALCMTFWLFIEMINIREQLQKYSEEISRYNESLSTDDSGDGVSCEIRVDNCHPRVS